MTTKQQLTPSGSTSKLLTEEKTNATNLTSSTWSSQTALTTRVRSHLCTQQKKQAGQEVWVGTEKEKTSLTFKMLWRKKEEARTTRCLSKWIWNMTMMKCTSLIATPTLTQITANCCNDCAPMKPKTKSAKLYWPRRWPATIAKWLLLLTSSVGRKRLQ